MTRSLERPRLVRLLAAACALALAAALLPAGMANAQDNGDDGPTGTEVLCDQFADVQAFPDTEGSTFNYYINCLAGYDIVQGRADGTYGFRDPVSRAQMATFIANMIETATGEEIEVNDDAGFPDVGDNNVFREDIEKLQSIGVVSGYPDGTYRSNVRVNRGQMASFVVNAIEYVTDTPMETSGTSFPDVAPTSTHAQSIDKLETAGIVEGFEDGLYRPLQLISRGQMAKFIAESMGYLFDAGFWPIDEPAMPIAISIEVDDDDPIVGITEDLTATATVEFGDGIVEETSVQFSATRNGEPVDTTVETLDDNDQATFTWPAMGAEDGDTDEVTVCVLVPEDHDNGDNGNDVASLDEHEGDLVCSDDEDLTASVSVTWRDPVPTVPTALELEVDNDDPVVGITEELTATATVTFDVGDLPADADEVRFTADRNGTQVAQTVVALDDDDQATFTWEAMGAEDGDTDTVVACVWDGEDCIEDLDDTVSVTWRDAVIGEPTGLTLEVDDETPTVGDTVTATATVAFDEGDLDADASVLFSATRDGETLEEGLVVDVTDGTATFEWSLAELPEEADEVVDVLTACVVDPEADPVDCLEGEAFTDSVTVTWTEAPPTQIPFVATAEDATLIIGETVFDLGGCPGGEGEDCITFAGIVDTVTGTHTIPGDGVSFPTLSTEAGGVPLDVNIVAPAGASGDIDLETGELTFDTELQVIIDLFGNGIDDCRLDVDLAATTGVSGDATGSPLNESLQATIVDGLFAVPAATQLPAPALPLCSTVSTALDLPSPSGDNLLEFDLIFDLQ